MSPLIIETKRILIEQFGKPESVAHWMAANNWTDHGRHAADLALARQQALANLERRKAAGADKGVGQPGEAA